MDAAELQQWLLSDAVRDDLSLLTQATVVSELGNVVVDEDFAEAVKELDWERLLLAGSILAKSHQRAPLEAALRIATAALNLDTSSEVRDAGTVLLQKLSNYRAIEL